MPGPQILSFCMRTSIISPRKRDHFVALEENLESDLSSIYRQLALHKVDRVRKSLYTLIALTRLREQPEPTQFMTTVGVPCCRIHFDHRKKFARSLRVEHLGGRVLSPVGQLPPSKKDHDAVTYSLITFPTVELPYHDVAKSRRRRFSRPSLLHAP